jgi:hypothetical protein
MKSKTKEHYWRKYHHKQRFLPLSERRLGELSYANLQS